MGLTCPGAGYDSINDSLQSLLVQSVSLDNNVRSTLRSISFNGRDSDPAKLKAFGSGEFLIKESLSFNGREMDPFNLDTKISIESPTFAPDKSTKSDIPKTLRFSPLGKRPSESTLIKPDSPKHEAAVKLQKVYKSFRTRRQLADCAVLVEQRWWKLIDYALLKRSSVSFFDIEKPESAVSRWSRARTRAAKVGKGLSKDEKAQKLALQHWLEAVSLSSHKLDVGEGKEVSLEQKCSRSKLQQQCIKYLGPKEREAYEVEIEDGKFLYRQSRQLLDTSIGPKGAKWIFVLSTSKKLYVGQKKKGTFQHSSFLAGGATSAAGRLVVENGVLKAVWPHSGHYRPTQENFQEFVSFLQENNVDLTDVKKSPTEEDDELYNRLRHNSSELNLAERNASVKPEIGVDLSHASSGKTSSNTEADTSSSEAFEGTNNGRSLANPKLGGKENSEKSLDMQLHCNLHNFCKQIVVKDNEESEDEDDEDRGSIRQPKRVRSDGKNEVSEDSSNSDKHYILRKKNLFLEEQEEDEETIVPSELILRRLNSMNGIKSYQLGKQLSFKWTTGAGPRIGCVRDYPLELQFRALEQVNLSPKSPTMCRFSSPRITKCQSPKSEEASL
ncbi:hypothetical protein C4D60_Mb04t13320 [Musa balbisiana]|uniref:IQ domain-containing protein IQM2-like n=1 Tax=Musa balbisiana TaxID=52838 RepID=A0A4S8KBT1_MUSBA|nr:hypothetical protein C4D60_Mb04t13320 [Musa balbisiana]